MFCGAGAGGAADVSPGVVQSGSVPKGGIVDPSEGTLGLDVGLLLGVVGFFRLGGHSNREAAKGTPVGREIRWLMRHFFSAVRFESKINFHRD